MPTQTQAHGRMDSRDAKLLIQFLKTLGQVLDVTIKTEGLFIPRPFQQVFLDAWREVQPSIPQLIRLIRSRRFDAKLRANGLAGPQLAMKMAVYQDALETLRSFFSQIAPDQSSRSGRESAPPRKETIGQKARKRGRQLLKYFFYQRTWSSDPSQKRFH